MEGGGLFLKKPDTGRHVERGRGYDVGRGQVTQGLGARGAGSDPRPTEGYSGSFWCRAENGGRGVRGGRGKPSRRDRAAVWTRVEMTEDERAGDPSGLRKWT